MSPAAFILGTLALLATGDEVDPRIALVEQQLAKQHLQALARTEELIRQDPALAREIWLDYLQAHLLEAVGRTEDAHEAFARLLSADSAVAAYARLRLAQLEARMGHPEVAAGLVATLLGRGAPSDLVEPAASLLIDALGRGADCRLLGRLPAWNVPGDIQRRLQLANVDCAARAGDSMRSAELARALLDERTDDLTARAAAVHLSEQGDVAAETPERMLQIGMAFHYNREFERSTRWLRMGLDALGPEQSSVSPGDLFGYGYANARGRFWLRRYAEAAPLFEQLATVAPTAEATGDCLYQAARSHELLGQWTLAATTFRRAYLADEAGDWAGPALLSALRIEFRTGRERQALELFAVLDSRLEWQGLGRRAALFMASSDIVRGRGDRSADWLRRQPGRSTVEFEYWRGRLAELQNSPDLAIRHYLNLLRQAPHHPLAEEAWRRLRGGQLAPRLEPAARALAARGRRADLHSAWLLLGDQAADGLEARRSLQQQLLGDRRSEPYLRLEHVQPPLWPLWNHPLSEPGDRLLAIGVWNQSRPRLLEHFPVNQPSLAFTGSLLLSRAGQTKPSLYVAEIMAQRVPTWVPEQLLPDGFRRLLYPFPYRSQIVRQSDRHGVEPELLAGLIREESRFDPQAVSAASARGLTQFVFSTAVEIGAEIGLGGIEPEQLDDPEISIALGAAYLARLLERFDGREELTVTAYNAGEEQVRVWRSYCYSLEPGEYFSKVGFPQTRSYLRKVLSSRNQYREIYAGP